MNLVGVNQEVTLKHTRVFLWYAQKRWSKAHSEPLDEDALYMFLCDEHRSRLSSEQKRFASRCLKAVDAIFNAVLEHKLQSPGPMDLDELEVEVKMLLDANPWYICSLTWNTALLRRRSALVPVCRSSGTRTHQKS